ncbi:hypothetical protein BGP_4807 [Beggiatoa sp. PS]|nr:hypothetical protein BGP_4807 [Beggiatoa sp. PS]
MKIGQQIKGTLAIIRKLKQEGKITLDNDEFYQRLMKISFRVKNPYWFLHQNLYRSYASNRFICHLRDSFCFKPRAFFSILIQILMNSNLFLSEP